VRVFIVFAEKTVKKPVKGGLQLQTYCPRCWRTVEMRELKWRRYFTLFFVPVFPLERKGDAVLVCSTCDGSYVPQYEDYLEGAKQAAASDGARSASSGSGPLKVAIRCPYCKFRLRIPDLGKTLAVTCAHCGRKFDVNRHEVI